MKRRIAVLLGILFMLSCISGCGSSSEVEEETISNSQDVDVVQKKLVTKSYTQTFVTSVMSVTTQYDYETMQMECILREDGEVVGSLEGLFEVDAKGHVVYEEVGSWGVDSGEGYCYPKTTEYYDNGTIKEEVGEVQVYGVRGVNRTRYNDLGLLEYTMMGCAPIFDATSGMVEIRSDEVEYTYEYTEHDANGYPKCVVRSVTATLRDFETDQVIATSESEDILELRFDENGRLTKEVFQDEEKTWQYDDQGNLVSFRYTEGEEGPEEGYWFESVTTYIYE